MIKKHVNLLYKELSYEIRGVAIEVKKNYGPGHKEVLYQRAFAEELRLRGITTSERNLSKYIRQRLKK